jgi:integrase
LNEQALAILQELKSATIADLVFEAVSFSREKAQLDAAIPPVADLPPWTLHDLRRTAASGMAGLGVRIETVEKILNHASGSFRGIVAVNMTSPPKNGPRSTFGAPKLLRWSLALLSC